MGPPWLLYSDEKLLKKFERDALHGKEDVIRWNQILYERFYFDRGNFTKAKPFLDAAAELGDRDERWKNLEMNGIMNGISRIEVDAGWSIQGGNPGLAESQHRRTVNGRPPE